ncbi:phosphate uptake regulator PhoU [Candidatus Woesearchaeota archaeon]|nr:phosphate uptake regulator PhoU [Candidatus Woesearchaeota archaeon]
MDTRKLIAHGPSSLTVALPYRWVKKHRLQKGDSVSIAEEDQGLRINPKPAERKKAISIDLRGLDWPSTLTVLTTVYRRGYDNVDVKYDSPEEYNNISTAVRSLLGYAIMENRKGVCLIKSLPSELEQDFPSLFRRVFLILLQELDDLGEMVSSPDLIKNFYRRDADLNAIVNLAIRMINKGYVQDRFEELHLFHALLVMEECGDDITRFTIELHACKEPHKLHDEIGLTAKMLRLLYDGYFQKKAGINDFYHQYYLYWPGEKKKAAPVLDALTASKKPVFYLRSMVEKIVHLAEVLLLPQME